MATTTNNLKLVKPDYTESADIGVINRNMDIIDEAYSNIGIVNTAIGEYISVYDSLEKPLQGLNVYGESTQDGEPSLDYQQDVEFVGKYYKGGLMQGYRNASGVFVSSVAYVTNQEMIPCKENDVIKLIYEENISALGIYFWDKDGNRLIENVSTSANEVSANAPANVAYFSFIVNNSDITPTNAKPISITINGKYMVNVKVKGKNELKNVAINQSLNGTTMTVNKDKSVTLNGTPTADAFFTLGTYSFKANESVILNGCDSDGNFSKYALYCYVDNAYKLDVGNGVVITPTTDSTVNITIVVRKDVPLNNLKFYPMIRSAEVTDDTYEPYNEQTLTVATDGLNGIGEVKDYIDFEKGVKVQKINKVVIDENSNINSSIYQGYNRFSVVIPSEYASIYPFDKGLCTHLKYSKDVLLASTDDNTISVYTTGTIVVAYFRMDKFTTVDELKTWLASNPMEVYYELATPIETPLTQAEIEAYKQLHTNKPATTITSDSVATIECEYMADVKNYIDYKINQLATAILQV